MNILESVISFALGLGLVGIFASLITARLRLTTAPSYLLSLYLLSYANIVLVSELAGLLGLLANKFVFLALQIALAAIAYLVWARNGHPALLAPMHTTVAKYKDAIPRITSSWPAVAAMATAVAAFYLLGAFLILYVPPNNHDSMVNHMARVGYWLHHGDFRPWQTWTWPQVPYPINAQVQILWTIVLWGWDLWAGFPQWLSAFVGMVAIYGLARLLGWTRPQSAFSALTWALMPIVLLESTTTQNHLIASSLFLAMIFLVFSGIDSGKKEMLFLSAIAFGLALGTHQYTVMAIPGLALAMLWIWLKLRRAVFRPIMVWGFSSTVAMLVLGSFMYIQNVSLYGDPLASNVFYAKYGIVDVGESFRENAVARLFTNAARYLYASFDLTGLPMSISNPIYDARTAIGTRLFHGLNLQVEAIGFTLSWRPPFISEDTAWFGLLGFLLFPFLFAHNLWRSVRLEKPFALALLLVLIGYVVCFALFFTGTRNAWSPYQGRYFILAGSLLAPFMAPLLTPSRLSTILCWAIVVLSIIFAIHFSINNYAKPLYGPRAIWGMSRIHKLDLNADRFQEVTRTVEQQVPAASTLGLVASYGFYEYPLFGQYLTRRLIPIYPYSRLQDTNWLRQQGVDWVLLCLGEPAPKDFAQIANIPSRPRDCSLLKRVR